MRACGLKQQAEEVEEVNICVLNAVGASGQTEAPARVQLNGEP